MTGARASPEPVQTGHRRVWWVLMVRCFCLAALKGEGSLKKSFACDAVLFKMSQFVSVIINHHSNAFIVHSSFITVTQKRLL